MKTAGEFIAHGVAVDGVPTIYRTWVSPSAPAPLPAVLFLHGAGESGSDGLSQTTVGLGPALRHDPERWPVLAVFPQASRGYGWRGFNLRAALAALDDAVQREPVDLRRVFVTGISMGGYGTWLAALTQPHRFAAAVPVCGGLDAPAAVEAGLIAGGADGDLHTVAARRLARLPQWVFHGDSDDVIPVRESRAMVRALEAAGASVRYTEYAGVRHNSWDAAYAEPALPEWLLARSLGEVSAATDQGNE